MSMLKTTASWADIFKEPNMQIVQLSRRGLQGSDYTSFVKRASDNMLADIDSIREKVSSDETLVHLLAIGATEDYGCFAAGTPFALADGTYPPIEQIAVGDHAYSADGHICDVAHLFRRTVDQSLQLDICGLADTLHCSIDHPFRVARKEQFVCSHDKYKRCLPPTFGQQNICNRPKSFTRDCVTQGYREIETEWATASTLTEGDFLVWTSPNLQPLWSMSVAEGYLLGAWLAEGCFQRNASNRAVASIRLAIHRDEQQFYQAIQTAAESLELTVNRFVGKDGSRNENCATVAVTGDPERFRLWLTVFKEHATGKVIPPWVCCLPRPVRLAIIAGYIDGDGSCTVDEKENRTTVRSHGRDLSLGFQRLCWSAGLPAVRCTAVDTGWNISIANSYLKDVEAFSWKVRGRELRQTTKVHGFYHEGRMYMPVRCITPAGAVDVFNMEVAGDHTYSGPNVDSHNCNRNGDGFRRSTCQRFHPTFEKYARFFRDHKNKDPKKSYGRIIKSAWNDRMRRIELLVALNSSETAAKRNGGLVADKEMEKLAQGKDIPVSMACRVPYDICSYCGNKASTVADYCTGTHQGGMCKAGGLQDNIGTLVEIDGGLHQLHADNDRPCFIDISHVKRGADRIAYVTGELEKVAGHVIKSADIAKQLGVVLPYEFMISGEQPSHVQRMVKLAYQLSQIETDLRDATHVPASALAFKPSVQGEDPLTVPELGREKAAAVFRALADQRICLPLSRFIEFTTKRDFDKSAEIAAIVSRELPGVYTQLLADTDLPDRLQACQFAPSTAAAPSIFSSWAAKLAGAMSLDTRHVDRRVIRASLYAENPEFSRASQHEKTAGSRDSARRLAEEYAFYKLAFLSSLHPDDPQLPLTCLLSVVQNYAH